MRIATWNVNSLAARIDKVWWWLARAQPDVLLLQETKLADADAPHAAFEEHGYRLAHHGEGRWNGVAIVTRSIASEVVINFGESQLGEARMIAARVDGVRVISIYAPNGRSLDTPFYEAKLAWYRQLSDWLRTNCDPQERLAIGGDFNIAPADLDVWDPKACHGSTHVSAREREAFDRLREWGLVDAYRAQHPDARRYSWWDYRAGNFHKNYGMRIDHLLVTAPLAGELRWAEIDREARKGKPTPSDHAPVIIDVGEPGTPLDAGWDAAEQRIAERRTR